jgi:hypothetical protein
MNTSKELAAQEPNQAPLGALNLVEYRNTRTLLLQVMHQEMKPGIDYGVTPGTSGKPSLWKPGAEKLVSMFAFAPSFAAECERHDGGHRTYTIKCTLKHRGTETFLGDADAVCSTLETKYASRKAPDGDRRIPNNPADFYNTCMKMGAKRALIAVVLFVTGASDIFTQDLDDDEENGRRANAGAGVPAGGLSRASRGVDTPGGIERAKSAPGSWTGKLAAVQVKTYKDKDGKTQEYYVLALEDGRSASTFNAEMAAAARATVGNLVKIVTKAGKKAGFFNAETFEVATAPSKQEPKEQQQDDSDLELGEEVPF